MSNPSLIEILKAIETGKLSADESYRQIRALHYEDIGFAEVDTHRQARCGIPEAIFCEGKTVEQICGIARRIIESGTNLLATHASEEIHEAVKKDFPDAVYSDAARTVVVKRTRQTAPEGEILVACAGTADMPVAEEARVTVEFLDNKASTVYDVGVAGLHRLLSHSEELRRANVIIVVAGMEGALASVVGGLVARPVIAVPTSIGYGASFRGIAPLLTMLNSCAPGVAVVNIDNGFGAGCVASLINHTGCSDEARQEGS